MEAGPRLVLFALLLSNRDEGLGPIQHNFTDGTGGNPYDHLPSYWDQEVAAIASLSVPEPSALAMFASGGLLVSLACATGWRGRDRA